MSKTLGGSVFCYNAISQDYSLKESVATLKALCDEVVVLDCGSTDGSDELVKSFGDKKTMTICLQNSEWESQQGKTKLSYFSNLAKSFLTTEWHFCQQADEIVHESCFADIREAIEEDEMGYMVTRINLWGNSHYQLEVPQNRKPVSTQIIRLCRTIYDSVDDAENIACYPSFEYVDKIRIYHVGYIRDKYKHIEKIKHIQDKVFLVDHDKRVDTMPDGFEPFVMFNREDIIPIKESLPIFIQDWCKERDAINGVVI